MYAVIQTGGKQYRVEEGQTLRVERLPQEVGADVDLDKVLMVADGDKVQVGAPYVDGGKVTAKVAGHGRDKKVQVIKFKRRQNYHRKYGHRQHYTELKITGIKAG